MKYIFFILSILFSSFGLAQEDTLVLINQGTKINITTADLEKLPSLKIKTSTNFTPQSIFTGVKLSDLLKNYHVSSDVIRVFAWDDYSYTLPVAELLKYQVILAYKKNNEYMDMSEMGPYAIIYPRDIYHELKTLEVNAKTVWQVKTIEGF
ncbi:molybdopterin-dependent oxidoreductase [Erwinia pyrifoliae]|uniref:molybdopterin-dependent oxidoreductase n=1 Tax=Erwinia pyrifoliae TaxID=79967 RepID=UPI00223B8ABB|nr:molybdopterin-dependent oxidoreductase [Erwinia pyrifoliae]MCT2386549.1 molybdopterin-dependent oxidoreductase [Erwinia pyrifoliae]MCU8587854.1 molybdopterin-dependent oxidoreductase [Erwinia pyrifoliae]